MKWLTLGIVFLAAGVAGCQTVAHYTPSLQYCSKIDYQRRGNLIHLEADCEAPIGGGVSVIPGL